MIVGQFFNCSTGTPFLPKKLNAKALLAAETIFRYPPFAIPLYNFCYPIQLAMLIFKQVVSCLSKLSLSSGIPYYTFTFSLSQEAKEKEQTKKKRSTKLLFIIIFDRYQIQSWKLKKLLQYGLSQIIILKVIQFLGGSCFVMQVKNYSEIENRSSTISENSEPELRKTSSVSKIIDSYQLLLSCCNKKIAELTTDLQLTREKLQITETRYSTLIDHLDDKDKANIDKLTDKIDELEKKLISKNAQIVRLKGKILMGEKDINQQKDSNFGKGNINKFFNFQCIRENQLILKRQRRNSVQQQQNSFTWEKAFEQFNSQIESPTKFKLKTSSMLKKFIPHEQRAKIWPYVFQNQLGITTNLYIELLERRSKDTIEQHVISQIHRDIVRSFNSKVDMGDKEVIGSQVQQILEIFHLLRPDVSYVQGMTYPALMLTIVVGKIQAFKIFSNLILCNKFFRNMYSFEEKAIQIYCKVFQILLRQNLPEVGKHIQSLNINPQLFLIQWFFTIFSRGLSLETTLKIWDLLGYQKELLLYKICLSIFELIEKNLLSYRYEESIGLIQSYWANIDENKLLQLVLCSKLTNQKLSRVFMKVSKQVHGTQKRERRESLKI